MKLVSTLLLGSVMSISASAYGLNNVNPGKSYVEGGVPIHKEYGIKNYGTDKNKCYEVTDADWDKPSQPRVEINLTKWGITDYELSSNSFNTIVLIIELDIAEIDDGYQEVYVNYYSPNGTEYLLGYNHLEHGGSTKNKDFERYEFYAELPASYVQNYVVWLRFGAHGRINDDWQWKALQVQVCASTETYKINDLAYIQNAKTEYFNNVDSF